jgi:hypothetical protein
MDLIAIPLLTLFAYAFDITKIGLPYYTWRELRAISS